MKKIFVDEGFKRVLVDIRLQTSMPDIIGIFNFATIFPSEMKIAVWISANQATIAEVEFVQLVATNRGAQMQLFTERDSAITWLGI